ncbi:TonB-linked outer membrane protein, SusC/RagA family [Parapedobacter composti]|uniref:TonB-linked outer membrane protein, SusC/RagA family n=1 Tax=Parapedobacter composti TaxID=623281 RepID=A0A1I1E1K6_9SPHI|nr:SusC/RagA family TonB-linked outer membrane protein [Parapedobacter composti]SFB80954.1 TonB-linked outer membrane protein, SusC/RagA family [Parapedobacter composti]
MQKLLNRRDGIWFATMVWLLGCQLSYAQPVDSLNRTPEKTGIGQLTIKGKVVSASTGEPIAGVHVEVAGYSSEFTDDAGGFVIGVPHTDAVLQASAVGFLPKRVAVSGKPAIELSLIEEGYPTFFADVQTPTVGKQPLSTQPWAIHNVSMADKWPANSETPDSYLQGRVAGLHAIRRAGTPGSGANLFLRGFSSIYANNQPLIVVDGMIYDNKIYAPSIIPGHASNPFGMLDLRDIDDITVVKDGASQYGTRSANGVILITTARAKEEATHIDFAAYGGLNATVAALPVMGSSDYRVFLSDLYQSRGMTPQEIGRIPFMRDDPNPDYYRYHNHTDWQREVMSNGYNQNYYLKVTGGDNIATYGLSVGYNHQEGLFTNTGLDRYHTRFNGALNLSQKLDATVSLAFTSTQQDLRSQGEDFRTNPLLLSQIKAPFLATHVVSDEGQVSPNLAELDIFNVSNPMSVIENMIGSSSNYRFFGSTSFNYRFNEQFSAHTLFGVTFDKVRETVFIPERGIAPDTMRRAVIRNQSGVNLSRYYALYNDTRLSFRRSFNHVSRLTASLGIRYNHSQSENDSGFGFNSATDDLVTVGHGVGELRQLAGSLGRWNWLNTYLTADYQYRNRYLLSMNVAADASSRFGTEVNSLRIGGVPFAVLPSLAAGWLLSSEPFMAAANGIDLLKLRVSYGLTGNDDIGNYTARKYYTSQNLLGMQGLVRGNIGNPGLRWETVEKVNVGIDMAFFNERLQLTADVYRSHTRDLLIWQQVPAETGMQHMLTNQGAMRTHGVDVYAFGRLARAALKWDMGILFSMYRNRVVDLPLGSIVTTFGGASYVTAEGQAANQFYGYKTDGLFLTQQEAADARQYNRQNGVLVEVAGGDVRFVNIHDAPEDQAAGITVIDENDRQVIGDPNPDFTGMWSNHLKWHRWALDVHVAFSYGNDIYNAQRAALETQASTANQSLAVRNRWRTDGQVTDMPRLAWGDPLGNARFSDRWIEDGSFVRLRTVALSYTIPGGLKFINNLSVYLTANNLFTLTRYKGYDPEMSAAPTIFGQGVDMWGEPIFRSTQLGIRIGF